MAAQGIAIMAGGTSKNNIHASKDIGSVKFLRYALPWAAAAPNALLPVAPPNGAEGDAGEPKPGVAGAPKPGVAGVPKPRLAGLPRPMQVQPKLLREGAVLAMILEHVSFEEASVAIIQDRFRQRSSYNQMNAA